MAALPRRSQRSCWPVSHATRRLGESRSSVRQTLGGHGDSRISVSHAHLFGRKDWLELLCLGGESRGFGRGSAPRARNIRAGAEIVMVGQAVAANVDIMNAAMNNRGLGAAKVASAANPLRLGLRRGWSCLDSA